MSDDYLIKDYTTTDDRIVRVYQDNDYGDPLTDELLDPETRKEMHELWVEGKVFRPEVFPRDIKLLDYENGVDVEFMGGFFGEDGPESYYPNVELYEVETLMENDEYRWCVLHDFHVGEGWTRSKEFTDWDEMTAFLKSLQGRHHE